MSSFTSFETGLALITKMRLNLAPSRSTFQHSRHVARSVTSRDFGARHRSDSSIEIKSIYSLFDALSSKGVVSLSTVLDADVSYEHRPFNDKDIKAETHYGFNDVLDFYSSAMSRAPKGLAFVLDEAKKQEGNGESFSVTFHLEIEGISLPWSKTTGLYTFSPVSKKLIRIQESSELPLQLALPVLSLTSPALTMASPLFPTLKGASHVIEDAIKHIPFIGSSNVSSNRSVNSSNDAESMEVLRLKADVSQAHSSLKMSEGKVKELQGELEELKKKLKESEEAYVTSQADLSDAQRRTYTISNELKQTRAQVESLEKDVMDGMLRGMVKAKMAEAEQKVQEAERRAVNKMSQWRLEVVEAHEREEELKATIAILRGQIAIESEERRRLEVARSHASIELEEKMEGEKKALFELHQAEIDSLVAKHNEEVSRSSSLLAVKDKEMQELKAEYEKVSAMNLVLYEAQELSDQEMKDKEAEVDELSQALVAAKAESDAALLATKAEYDAAIKAREAQIDELSRALVAAETNAAEAVRERDSLALQLSDMNSAIAQAQDITNQVLLDMNLNSKTSMPHNAASDEEESAEEMSTSSVAINAHEVEEQKLKLVNVVPLPPVDTASPPSSVKHGPKMSKRPIRVPLNAENRLNA